MNAIYFCCIPWAAAAQSFGFFFNAEDQTDECTDKTTMCTGQSAHPSHTTKHFREYSFGVFRKLCLCLLCPNIKQSWDGCTVTHRDCTHNCLVRGLMLPHFLHYDQAEWHHLPLPLTAVEISQYFSIFQFSSFSFRWPKSLLSPLLTLYVCNICLCLNYPIYAVLLCGPFLI